MLSIITGKKRFDDYWIGNAFLNQRGLHRWRMQTAEACAAARRSLSRSCTAAMQPFVEQIDTDGYAVVADFLPDEVYASLAREVETAFGTVERERPVVDNAVPGFGAKMPFPGGFDRYDGGTLNRFLFINRRHQPTAARFAGDSRLSALTHAVCGRPHLPRKTHLYLTVHGHQARNADIQKDFHRDTYFCSMKFWYFLDPVTVDDGPFTYVRGSHRLTETRLAWEQATANQVVRQRGEDQDRAGSFRISAQQLQELGYEAPTALTCPGNTLIIANTLGFHRRGDAVPGRRRVALYGWHRPYPFGLIGV